MNITQEDNLLIQSYVTTSFLVELKNNNFLNSDYFKSIPFKDKSIKEILPKIGIDNQGALLMSLYSMLVIPKQLLSSKFPTEFENLNKKIGLLKTSENSTYKSDKNGIDYIRHIRNAVAHARVSFNPTKDVTFFDVDGNQKCTIIIPLVHISLFLIELQNIFIQYYKSLHKVN